MIADEIAKYTPLRTWMKGKEIDESIIDFKTGIENDLEQLSQLLGIDLVIMTMQPIK